jgi:hypothetical protein
MNVVGGREHLVQLEREMEAAWHRYWLAERAGNVKDMDRLYNEYSLAVSRWMRRDTARCAR